MYTLGVRGDLVPISLPPWAPQAGRASASSSPSVKWGENKIMCGFRIGKLLQIDSC